MTLPLPTDRPTLTGEVGGTVVRLRPLRPDDIDAIVTASRDPTTVRWTTVPDPYQRTDAEDFVTAHADRCWTAGGGLWAMCADGLPGGDDAYAGAMELRVHADPAVGDVGYACAPWGRGRGLTTAALVLACRWGFAERGLARIEWDAEVGNDASRRVAEKAGFVFEGVRRAGLDHRGERRDAWQAGLLPADPLPPDLRWSNPPADRRVGHNRG